MAKQWMALVREGGNKRADWDIVAKNVSRAEAVKAVETRCRDLGIAYRLGYKFSDGTQQVCYTDAYDGSPILGKIAPQSENRDVIHSVPT